MTSARLGMVCKEVFIYLSISECGVIYYIDLPVLLRSSSTACVFIIVCKCVSWMLAYLGMFGTGQPILNFENPESFFLRLQFVLWKSSTLI